MRDPLATVLIVSAISMVLLHPGYVMAADTLGARPWRDCRWLSDKDNGTFYPLPDPGMLINHKLYIVKSTRDNILGFLIRTPPKKIEFQTLQADKFLNMSAMLFARTDQWKWVPVALSRSRDAASLAYRDMTEVQAAGSPLPNNQKDGLEKSVRKHLEVVGEMHCHTVSPQLENAFADDLHEMERLLRDIRELH